MPHPEMETLKNYEKSLRPAMQPVYPSTELLSSRGISNRVLYNLMENLFSESQNYIVETLPKNILETLNYYQKKKRLPTSIFLKINTYFQGLNID